MFEQLSKLPFRNVEDFVSIAELGSVAAMSRKTGRRQDDIIASIYRLEAAIGERLFQRAGGILRLTTTAKTLLPYARAKSLRIRVLRDKLVQNN